MMNLVKEVVIDPILPSSYALLDSYSDSLLSNLQRINHSEGFKTPKYRLDTSDMASDVNSPQMKNFFRFQIKFMDKFYEMANSSTWVENLQFVKYKTQQFVVNEYLQTSFFRYGLYSNAEFDIEANLLDYNIWAYNYSDYAMLSDKNDAFLSYESQKDESNELNELK